MVRNLIFSDSVMGNGKICWIILMRSSLLNPELQESLTYSNVNTAYVCAEVIKSPLNGFLDVFLNTLGNYSMMVIRVDMCVSYLY